MLGNNAFLYFLHTEEFVHFTCKIFTEIWSQEESTEGRSRGLHGQIRPNCPGPRSNFYVSQKSGTVQDLKALASEGTAKRF